MSHGFAETYPQHLYTEIGGGACALFHFTIAKTDNVACLQRIEVAIAFCFPEKPGKPFDHALVASVRRFLASIDFASIALASVHVSHHDLMDAFGNDSTFAAVNTSLTPYAITSRAASTVSLPLRALSAALCHARQISSACFRSLVFVDRKTRLLVWVSGFQIENAQHQYGLPG